MTQSTPFQSEIDAVKVPCTCGELFQGLIDGQACLVSCPIDNYSIGRKLLTPTNAMQPRKVNQALKALAQHTGIEPAKVETTNPLPAGRGYGTSTADICAALFAAAPHLPPETAARIAVEIEPTDSTVFPGLTLFDHKSGSFHLSLGEPPPAQLIILDPGGFVDSEDFNAIDWSSDLARVAGEQKRAFELLKQGIMACDLPSIGQAATMSARCHQSILYSPLVEQAISYSQEVGAVGVCRAHSGTVVGLLFPMEINTFAAVQKLSRHFKNIMLWQTQLTGGGPSYSYNLQKQETHS